MARATNGATVRIHYVGKLRDGSVFDTSRDEDREPMEFVLGGGQVIPGFDAGVTGMQVGECKTVVIPPEQGYGLHREELVYTADRDVLPPEFRPAVGEFLVLSEDEDHDSSDHDSSDHDHADCDHDHSHDESGTVVRITALDDESVTLDANHELAGQELTFEIELIEVR